MSDSYEDVLMLEAPPHLASTMIGPMAMGYIFEILFYGAFCTLFISHCVSGEFQRMPGRIHKIMLGTLFFLVTVCSAVTLDALWKLAVLQDRRINTIAVGPVESCSLTLLSGLIGAITQAALARRAGTFIENRKIRWLFYMCLAALVVVSVFGSLAATVFGFIWAVQTPNYFNTLNWSTCVAIWLWSAAVADCVICGALAWSLGRRVAGFNSRTDSLLKRLAWYSVRSASYTAIVAVGGAVAGSLYGDSVLEWTNLTVAFWAPMPPLYGIAYFTTTSSSRRAIETAFGAEGSDAAAGALPSVHVQMHTRGLSEKSPRGGGGASSRLPSLSKKEKKGEHMSDRAGGGGVDARPRSRSRVLELVRTRSGFCARSDSSLELDMESGSGRGASDLPSLFGHSGKTRSNGGGAPRELRIQVEQHVESHVDEPETPPLQGAERRLG
ncbi:hypothetical protein JCM3770_005770 [Rhodotorula araucariae]